MKDTIETDVWDNSIEDNFSSNWTLDDAVEADRKNLQINKSDVEQLIKTSEEIRKTADQLIGIGQDFCSLFVTETGQLRDFTDKEGRKKLQKAIVYMLDNVKGIGTTIHDHEENMKNLCKETLHAIPKEITTQFCKEDRKRLDFFQDKLNKYGKLLIVGFILTGIILGITISAGVANISRANELKEIEYENSQEIEFGKFMRENNPKTWRHWQQVHSTVSMTQSP